MSTSSDRSADRDARDRHTIDAQTFRDLVDAAYAGEADGFTISPALDGLLQTVAHAAEVPDLVEQLSAGAVMIRTTLDRLATAAPPAYAGSVDDLAAYIGGGATPEDALASIRGLVPEQALAAELARHGAPWPANPEASAAALAAITAAVDAVFVYQARWGTLPPATIRMVTMLKDLLADPAKATWIAWGVDQILSREASK